MPCAEARLVSVRPCAHPLHFPVVWGPRGSCAALGLWPPAWGTSTKTRTHLEVQTEMYPKKTFQPAGKFSPSYP